MSRGLRNPRLFFLWATLLTAFSCATADESLNQLMARAKEKGDHQAENCALVVRREVHDASDYFKSGEMDKGYAAVQQAGQFTDLLLEAAQRSKKNLKQTEMILRATSRELSQLADSLPVEDRSPLEHVHRRIDDVCSQVLNLLFAPDKKQP